MMGSMNVSVKCTFSSSTERRFSTRWILDSRMSNGPCSTFCSSFRLVRFLNPFLPSVDTSFPVRHLGWVTHGRHLLRWLISFLARIGAIVRFVWWWQDMQGTVKEDLHVWLAFKPITGMHVYFFRRENQDTFERSQFPDTVKLVLIASNLCRSDEEDLQIPLHWAGPSEKIVTD